MKVYIKTDEKNRVTAINSEIFISDTTGWVEIDRGDGDKFSQSQGNYLPKPLTGENRIHRYKYENGVISERSADEMAADMPEPAPIPPTNAELAAAIAELAGVIMSG